MKDNKVWKYVPKEEITKEAKLMTIIWSYKKTMGNSGQG